MAELRKCKKGCGRTCPPSRGRPREVCDPCGGGRRTTKQPRPAAPPQPAQPRAPVPPAPPPAAAPAPATLDRFAVEGIARSLVQTGRRLTAEGNRLLALLAEGAGGWRCRTCGPLGRREGPLSASDGTLRCPHDGCDDVVEALEREPEKPGGTPWKNRPAVYGEG